MKPYIDKDTKTLFLNKIENHKYTIAKNRDLRNVEVSYYMTAISEEDVKVLNSYISATKEEKEKLTKQYPHIDLENIILLGNANKKYGSYSNMKGLMMTISRFNRELPKINPNYEVVFYRNYQVTEEKWEESLAYLNPCPDIKMSWQSAIRALGAKGVHGLNNSNIPFYVVIWFKIDK